LQQLILVNEQDEPVGVAEKMEAHQKGLLHRAFSIFIFNEDGKMLLQQRAKSKYHSGMAQEGGIGVLHKNMTIAQQAAEVRKVKRAESGMIIYPVTLPLTSSFADAKNVMKEFGIG